MEGSALAFLIADQDDLLGICETGVWKDPVGLVMAGPGYDYAPYSVQHRSLTIETCGTD